MSERKVTQEMVQRFYQDADVGSEYLSIGRNADSDTAMVTIDGVFTLEHLKKIVAAWEKLIEEANAR